MKDLKDSGNEISSLLFSCAMSINHVSIDTLHAVDPQFHNMPFLVFLWVLISNRSSILDRNAINTRVHQLWNTVNGMHKKYKTPRRLHALPKESSKGSKLKNCSPKLRCKGGACRHLVPPICELASQFATENPTVRKFDYGSHLPKITRFPNELSYCMGT